MCGHYRHLTPPKSVEECDMQTLLTRLNQNGLHSPSATLIIRNFTFDWRVNPRTHTHPYTAQPTHTHFRCSRVVACVFKWAMTNQSTAGSKRLCQSGVTAMLLPLFSPDHPLPHPCLWPAVWHNKLCCIAMINLSSACDMTATGRGMGHPIKCMRNEFATA